MYMYKVIHVQDTGTLACAGLLTRQNVYMQKCRSGLEILTSVNLVGCEESNYNKIKRRNIFMHMGRARKLGLCGIVTHEHMAQVYTC
jgi:hypothetical protein